MNQCPITHSKQQHAEKLAIQAQDGSYTYADFDQLIGSIADCLAKIKNPLLATTPIFNAHHIAFFFAAWRLGKTVYPLSFRLPKEAVEKRLSLTGARWIDPMKLNLSAPKKEHTSFSGATLLETSGTSGHPKIVHHPLESHLISAKSSCHVLDLGPGDTYCLNLPLFHISGLTICLRSFLAGATVTFADRIYDATHISLVPTQLYRLLKETNPLPKAKCVLLGGSPISQKLKEKANLNHLPLFESYGMTETSAMAFCNGKPLPHIEYKLSSENELLVRGPSLFTNYWGEENIADNDWFPTKDLAQIDKDGSAQIVGRKDRQFISGGENIQPEEIERSLLSIAHVISAKVTPVESKEFGMVPVAHLEVERPFQLNQVIYQLKKQLPSFKVPKAITIEKELENIPKK